MGGLHSNFTSPAADFLEADGLVQSVHECDAWSALEYSLLRIKLIATIVLITEPVEKSRAVPEHVHTVDAADEERWNEELQESSRFLISGHGTLLSSSMAETPPSTA